MFLMASEKPYFFFKENIVKNKHQGHVKIPTQNPWTSYLYQIIQKEYKNGFNLPIIAIVNTNAQKRWATFFAK